MPEHQKRVIEEKHELDEKRRKLHDFMEKSEIYKLLPADEQTRLTQQAYVMSLYSDILAARISAF